MLRRGPHEGRDLRSLSARESYPRALPRGIVHQVLRSKTNRCPQGVFFWFHALCFSRRALGRVGGGEWARDGAS
jgi:hypothetical protein